MKKNASSFYSFFIFSLLIFSPLSYGNIPDFLENAVGIIIVTHSTLQGYYEDEKKPETLSGVVSQCNGFLVRKDEKIYFLSVKHVLTIYKNQTIFNPGRNFITTKDDKTSKIEIVFPKLGKKSLNIILSDKNTFEVPETWYGLANGTADCLAVEITEELKNENLEGKVIPYENLAGITDGVIINKINQMRVVGYPKGDRKKDIRELTGDWDKNFGGIINLSNAANAQPQRARGFLFGIELAMGDCGSPLLIFDGTKMCIVGLMRTNDKKLNFSSIATDSIVIRDAINRREMS